MLSAVENHFGPNRSYVTGAHHYTNGSSTAGSNSSSLIAPPCPIVALPSATAMSAEFARPHPKTNRYNGNHSLRNGLSSSPRGKYSQLDQSAPVNLAVSQTSSENNSTLMNHKPSSDSVLTAAAKPSSLESEQDAISSSIASLYQHKLAYGPPPSERKASMTAPLGAVHDTSSAYTKVDPCSPNPSIHLSAAAAAAAQSLYYPNYYGRPPGSVYGGHMYAPPPTVSTHSLSSRNPLHHSYQTNLADKFGSQICPSPHVDAYSNPYLYGATTYSPPAPTRPGLSPHSPIGAISTPVAPIAASQNNNSSISANSSPISISPPSIYTQQPPMSRESQQYHVKSSPHNEHINQVATKISNSYRSESKDRETKVSHHQSNGKMPDFKIPSGKEGSLKHRILTRPFSEKDSPAKQQKSAPQTNSQSHIATKSSVRSSSNNNNNTNSKNKNLNSSSGGISNFSKGTLIELSSGELKRVEDMRTEDFITSSSKNPNLQLVDTTVVKIVSKPKNLVVITLSYNNNKICIETQPSHPFFVYGKNWASFNPDGTFHEHGLKCQLLEVGDVCISLTPRDQPHKQPQKHNVSSMLDNTPAPQNLSRKPLPYTISTTATATAVTSRPIPTFDTPSVYNHQLMSQPMYAPDRYDDRALTATNLSQSRALHPDPSSRKYNISTMAPPPPPPSSSADAIDRNHLSNEEEAIDATMHSSRKRRWSAPDNICDVNGCQLEQKKCKKH